MQWFRTKYQVDPSGCWLWLRSVRDGYGRTQYRGKKLAAHRRSWELHRGPIPPKLFVCHKCDVPLCVNPEHLFLGTHDDNMADMVAKARTTKKRGPKKPKPPPAIGELHPRAKLTWLRVREIRKAFAESSAGIRPLARAYGVSPLQIRRIVRGDRWREPGPSSILASPEPESCGTVVAEDVT